MEKMKKNTKKEILRTIKYTLFAMSAGAIQMIYFELFQYANGYNEATWWKSYLISIIFSVIWNFTFNRKFTFKSANNVPKAFAQCIAYYVVFIPFSVCLGQMYLVKVLHWNGTLIEFIMIFINFVTEFLYQRFYVFKDSIDQTEKKKVEE